MQSDLIGNNFHILYLLSTGTTACISKMVLLSKAKQREFILNLDNLFMIEIYFWCAHKISATEQKYLQFKHFVIPQIKRSGPWR